MQKHTTSDVLDLAIEVLDERGWGKGSWGAPDWGASDSSMPIGPVCLQGAVDAACNELAGRNLFSCGTPNLIVPPFMRRKTAKLISLHADVQAAVQLVVTTERELSEYGKVWGESLRVPAYNDSPEITEKDIRKVLVDAKMHA